ncbi:metal-dependent hydrolase [Patescibacteria group bacterium]|nr:metal-dependent hydrolase [Patescibacteria group bacterium]
MTGKTHDLAAFTALTLVFVSLPQTPTMSFATAITAFGANFVGGLFPDIDQPTSDLWDNFRLGPFIAKIICPALGGHRHISHSLIGLILIGALSKLLLTVIFSFILLDINVTVVWYCFMIGVISHIVMDLPTKAGVPLLWPFKCKFGIPPVKALRMDSGKFVENWIVFPSLAAFTVLLLYLHQSRVLEFIHQYWK